MKVLITGIDGLVGRAIANKLLDGYQIIGLSRSKNIDFDKIEYLFCDLSDKDCIDNFKDKKIDVIVHTAASTSKTPLDIDLVRSNCLGVHTISEIANIVGCKKFIFISGVTVIGKPEIIPVTEDHPIKPISTYLLTKYFGEEYLSLTLKSTCKLIVLRLTSPLGDGLAKEKIIPTFIKNTIAGKEITLFGKGKRVQNYVDVRDVANAVKLSIANDTSGVYNIAGEKSYSNFELAEICVELFKSSSVITCNGLYDAEEDTKWIVSINKAQRDLGYKPQYSIQETLIELSKYYK